LPDFSPLKSPLHIGLLTPALAGLTGVDSGIGAHFRHLAEALTADGHRVSVLLVCDQSTAAENLPFGVNVVQIRPSPAARLLGRLNWQLHQWGCLRASFRVAAVAARLQPVDIWETTSTGSLALEYLTDRRRAPVVTRVSTTAAQLRATNAGVENWISRRIEGWEQATVRRSNRVFTHSGSHQRAIAEEFGLARESIRIIPHGIPVPPEAPARSATISRCELLFVGRLEHRKGADLLLAALPAVLEAAPQVAVTLVGADREGHWQDRWRQTAAPALRDRVRFAGVVEPSALAAHYRTADLFVGPSRYESFGLIFAEAMAQALPVVALRTPGAADLIEDGVTGRLAPPEDVAGLAAVLTELALDPAQRQRLGAAGRRVVEAHYSLPALAAASTSFYRETLALR
jgi:glycosyltransferase involved in cell wall biosynthesis